MNCTVRRRFIARIARDGAIRNAAMVFACLGVRGLHVGVVIVTDSFNDYGQLDRQL